ncbi:T6SS immunity protein Tdi1 domain-containing protein [Streptomyces sp. NPDC006739]|uniref:T6SS immunity protein Tdi1 domain-containing protein n=1 Tax=Streptomyces sp. NPDC006739 TaxID=3364763 RepID=UPI00369EC85D
MYENFLALYPEDAGDETRHATGYLPMEMMGGQELVALGAGKSFGGGIMRIHDIDQSRRAAILIGEAFPEYRDRIVPFAKDWLGRQFAIPTRKRTPIAGQVLLIEPGSGDAFVVDATLVDLFDREMVEDPDTFLAADLFSEWRLENSERIPAGKCVGFKVPIFLGGRGAVDNLEVSDEEVYWSLCGQLRSQVKG